MSHDPHEGPPVHEVVGRLYYHLEYPRAQAEQVAVRLLALNGELASAFRAWWSSSVLQDVSRAGISASELVERYGMNPIAVLLTLSDLEADPEPVLRLLRRGLDTVQPSATPEPGPGKGAANE